MTRMSLKWNQSNQGDSKATAHFFINLLCTFWWPVLLFSLIVYELSIVWWLILLLLIFHVSASQLFVNCWVRAIASIVRAKRFYSDDILNNFFEIFFSSFYHMSFFLLRFFFSFSSFFFSLCSLHIQVASGCNGKQRFPFIATDRFIKIVKNHWFSMVFWFLGSWNGKGP